MNKQELTALVAEMLESMQQEKGEASRPQEPEVKGGDYRPTAPQPEQQDQGYGDGDFVPDITALNLRRLYLQEHAAQPEKFRKAKERTPARLGCGRAGPRYKTLTMLRFRADHAAAQDAVFSEVSPDFGEKNHMAEVRTRCRDKEEYLTRPDLGRCFDEKTKDKLKALLPAGARVQILIGDGLSAAAIEANAMDCCRAIQDGLKLRGIPSGDPVFVRYCRVGAGDALGDVTGCELICVLVGERPGLVTDKSMSVYLTYRPHTGVSESSRTVVSNIHSQGTPAAEAGAHVAELIETILKKQVSGVGLRQELGA